MNVYIYWDRRDNDCKKIYHCMSPNDETSIVEEMGKNNSCYIERVTSRYKDVSIYEERIKNSEVVIFCTHGTAEEILRYRGRNNENDVLINEENLYLLNDKVVLALCCSSATGLGKKSTTEPYSCTSYIGFEQDVLYDDGKVGKFRHIIYEAYKSAFSKSIIYALRTKCSVRQFKIFLIQMLRTASVDAVLKSEDLRVESIYAGAIASAVAYGEQDKIIFS